MPWVKMKTGILCKFYTSSLKTIKGAAPALTGLVKPCRRRTRELFFSVKFHIIVLNFFKICFQKCEIFIFYIRRAYGPTDKTKVF